MRATGSSETEVSATAVQPGERRLKPPAFIAKTIFAKARTAARDSKVTAQLARTSMPTIKALGAALCPLSIDSARVNQPVAEAATAKAEGMTLAIEQASMLPLETLPRLAQPVAIQKAASPVTAAAASERSASPYAPAIAWPLP